MAISQRYYKTYFFFKINSILNSNNHHGGLFEDGPLWKEGLNPVNSVVPVLYSPLPIFIPLLSKEKKTKEKQIKWIKDSSYRNSIFFVNLTIYICSIKMVLIMVFLISDRIGVKDGLIILNDDETEKKFSVM